WCTERAQEATYLGVQIHGGMGFIEETGAAQHMRDARIVTIYEGTTGIQALDLMGRKMMRDKGQAIFELIEEMKVFSQTLSAQADSFQSMAEQFSSALDGLEDCTRWFLSNAYDNPELAGCIGVNFQMLAGNVVCGWLMARSAIAAQAQLDAGSSDKFYVNKISTAAYFAEQILPQSKGLQTIIKNGAGSIMSIPVEAF
ncbi:MAG: acyl-CoA dehydrogenase, partial [Gammaproteobacteria bacterium]|nr:acyl-CoA dehydrogenase [Gammaproteobacteria bacterium]